MVLHFINFKWKLCVCPYYHGTSPKVGVPFSMIRFLDQGFFFSEKLTETAYIFTINITKLFQLHLQLKGPHLILRFRL